MQVLRSCPNTKIRRNEICNVVTFMLSAKTTGMTAVAPAVSDDAGDNFLKAIELDGQLIFDPKLFNAAEFNAERFFDRTRRRATLDQIHKDLRTLLQRLQYAMVGLINNDYTEFVKLSSSLASLNGAICNVSSEDSFMWEEYKKGIENIDSLASVISKKFDSMSESRQHQKKLSHQLGLIKAVKSLDDTFAAFSKPLTRDWMRQLKRNMYGAIIHYNELPANAQNKEVVRVYLNLYNSCERLLAELAEFDVSVDAKLKLEVIQMLQAMMDLESAVSHVSKNIVSAEIPRASLDVKMRALIDAVNKQRLEIDDYLNASSLSDELKVILEDFYYTCLLNYILNVFNEKFSIDLIPSSKEPFKSCYQMMCEFVQKFPSKKFPHLLQRIMNSFSTVVYIRLLTQPAINTFRESTSMDKLKIITCEDGPVFETSLAFVEAIKCALSEDVVLSGASNKFWSVAYSLDGEYVEWVRDLKKHLLTAESLPNDLPRWQAFLVACKKICWPIERSFTLGCDFFTRYAQVNDTTHEANSPSINQIFGRYNSRLEMEIKKQCDGMELTLVNVLYECFVKDISLVSDVLKQYRWTKIPAPKTHSEYVNRVIDFFSDVAAKAQECGWEETEILAVQRGAFENGMRIFAKKAGEVMDSVEQTGNSLMRLKKKHAPTSTNTGDGTETDESKTKSQLAFDIRSFLTMSQQFSDMEEVAASLNSLLLRAQGDAQ